MKEGGLLMKAKIDVKHEENTLNEAAIRGKKVLQMLCSL